MRTSWFAFLDERDLIISWSSADGLNKRATERIAFKASPTSRDSLITLSKSYRCFDNIVQLSVQCHFSVSICPTKNQTCLHAHREKKKVTIHCDRRKQIWMQNQAKKRYETRELIWHKLLLLPFSQLSGSKQWWQACTQQAKPRVARRPWPNQF